MAAIEDRETLGRARLSFADEADINQFVTMLSRFESGEISPEEWQARLDAASDACGTFPTHRDDPAIWLFSGGTTGRPKAAVQPHRSYVNTTECYARHVLGCTEDDITLSVPKLYFGYAMGSNLFFPFAAGPRSWWPFPR